MRAKSYAREAAAVFAVFCLSGFLSARSHATEDTTPPTGSILVNGGDAFTSTREVTLGLAWADSGTGVARMRFSDDGATWSAWETPAATRAHTLPAGADGHRTVRVQFLDRAGNRSEAARDYILLDTTPPSGAISINGGAPVTSMRAVTLGLAWADSGTGVVRMRFSDNGATWSPWEAPAATRAYTLPGGADGHRTVRVQFLDRAGHRSEVFFDHVRFENPAQMTILLPGGIPLELVKIPAGSFEMGSPETERGRFNKESPLHLVNFRYDFYMGKYELTQEQWFAVMGAWPREPVSDYGAGPDHPAYCVSWDDANAFISALNGHIEASGQGPVAVRLPSEAEWEYACRAGTQTRFYFGDSLDVPDGNEDDGVRSQYMWFAGNNVGRKGDPGYGTKRVGQKLPNAFGLYDMAGNVSEWCEDWDHLNYLGAPTDGSAWLTNPYEGRRIFRGGDWTRTAALCRSAFRLHYYVWYRYEAVGFRLAATR
ncbi:MAG TPA: formylglycine-generating enzyme family protein [Candidatus Hydrogenedentes bacterium]|nr:formylglycine-generating enzyme family protein [Candidatus Hydrogenedentota bacterium]